MKIVLFIIILVISIFIYPNPPTWVNNYFYDTDYYIGIGHCSKHNENYLSIARTVAIDEIASQLEISITGQVFQEATQENQQLQEVFKKQVTISLKSKIYDLELVEKYEEKDNYWVYYRLSKAKYIEQKNKDISNNINIAFNYYKIAKESERNNMLVNAMKSYFQALIPLICYVNEPLEVYIDGNMVNLFNEIFFAIMNLRKNLLISINPQQINVKVYQDVKENINIDVKYFNKNIYDIPISAWFVKGNGDLFILKDNELGRTALILNRVTSTDVPQIIRIEIDLLNALLDGNEEPVVKDILETFKNPYQDLLIYPVNIILYMDLPLVQLRESNMIEKLTNAGFSITDDINQADYLINIESITKKGNNFKNFYFAYSNTTINIIGQKNEINNSIVLSEIKGSAGDYTSAIQKSQNLAMEKVADNLIDYFKNK
ncbi:MAG: LPP20 family lipoprotein [Candidatus Cloacimonetes bacterium]|nr:LPP20 family lipoprotein [Candidatus Cloacimonadota bacterium]